MDIKNLLERWEKSSSAKLTAREYTVRLPIRDAARIAALAEMYPLKNEEEIALELLSHALDSIEAAFPYVQGSKVIAEDEMGDPIYEDAGSTPRFLALTRRHAALLAQEHEESGAQHDLGVSTESK